MAKRPVKGAADPMLDRAVRAIERLGLIVGAVAANQFEDADLPAKAKRLRRMGFTNVEIAQILSSTPNAVGVALHRGKKKGGPRSGGTVVVAEASSPRLKALACTNNRL